MSGCEPPGSEHGTSVGAFLCQAGQVLRAAAVEAPRLEARMLLAHAMGCRQEDLLRDPRAPVAPEAQARFREALAARARNVPMAHLLGHAGFWTLDLLATPATLIPRADTETLVEAALGAFPDRAVVTRLLDLGTGTGALLLACLAEFPHAFGIGVDRSPEAAALARANALRNGLAERAAIIAGDWAAALAGRFDLILSNPPYIETAAIPGLMPEVALHEPALALDGGADGLDAYRALATALPGLLAEGGKAVLELGQGQEAGVGALMRAAGLRVLGCRPDLGGIPRALIVGRV
ncbi:peptide chain release factor N(5)-glutamine methyltransferase [Muricoccus pecuniae]|uniref:Release factor glutamine methyltransferase n=1 Tax=Muricoccus pecuniae TaxID=693023 RepID=A0A840YC60_9PROT|nr:peptide chain release factor N(5)-glutamine methyltransferase [Roseomonas pecuniae]MBB5693947.1 release factor glutamine methyltransferase [Roseomonas pecuniae]